MSKTYTNNTGSPVLIGGTTVEAGGTIELDYYVHITDVDLTTDTTPTDLVLATGTASEDTGGTVTITPDFEGVDAVEVQVVSGSGKWEIYFNDATNTAAVLPASGAFNKVVPTKYLNSIILKATEDSATANYNVILEE